MKITVLTAILLLFCTKVFAQSQAGDLDPNFNVLANSNLGGGPSSFNSLITTSSIQNDGKIVVGGYFTSFGYLTKNRIARLNYDGSLDYTFNIGLGFDQDVEVLVIQGDGKILVGGNFTSYNSVPVKKIARINSDGSLDLTFNTGNGFNDNVKSINIQDDGKIIVGGSFTTFDGVSKNRFVRLNEDGTLDTSFNLGLGFNNSVYTSAIQDDGKILVGGDFTSYNGTSSNRIVRLNQDGTLDSAFNTGTGFDDRVTTICVQNDGKIITGGYFYNFNGQSRVRLTRLNSNGNLDLTFNIGSGFNNSVFTVKIQDNGKILVGGYFTNFNGIVRKYLTRLNVDGSWDNSLSAIISLDSDVRTISIQNNNQIIVAGSFLSYNTTSRKYIARLNVNGSLDAAGFNSLVTSTNVQSDGKILIGGYFNFFNGADQNFITRLNINGTVDSTFLSGIGFGPISNPSGQVKTICIQDDGKILVGGNFTSYNNSPINKIVRLNQDGTIDPTFISVITSVYSVETIKIQNDGKILVGGSFSLNGTTNLIRLNSDGSMDTNFNDSLQFIGDVFCIDIQSDDKFVVGGYFTSINGQTHNYLVRMDVNGYIDTTFNIGLGFNWLVKSVDIQDDGKILVGGYYTSFNGVNCNYLVRLNEDGSLDSTFNIGSGFNNIVEQVTKHTDNKIYVGGAFTLFNGNIANSFVRLNNNGAIDSTFQTNDGFNSKVTTFSFQDYDKLILGGVFTYYNDINRNRIARIYHCVSTSAIETVSACDSYTWPINNQTYTTSGQYIDTIPNAAGCDSIITLDLTIIPSLPLTISNTFSLPSDATTCVGELAVSVSGNADFELNVDNSTQIVNTSGYSLINNLCPGVHDLLVTDNCGDSLTTQTVIPIDSNYVFNNPFIDSIAVDSLGSTITNCDIYYNQIDTAYIDSIWATGNTVNVIWNIVDANGSNLDTSSYVLNNGNGVYWLQLSIFCPTKALGDYFTVTEAIYFNDGTISMADLTENTFQFYLYPNPTNNEVTLTFDSNEAQVFIYDTQGKLIQTKYIHSGEQVSLKEVETGVYFFEVNTEKGRAVKRVVKG